MAIKHLRLRRLSDKVHAAFHEACDQGEVEIAEMLLQQLGQITRPPARLPAGFDRRRPVPKHLTAPAERLMNLLLWQTPTVDTDL